MESRLLIWVSKIRYRRSFRNILQIPSRCTNNKPTKTWKRGEIQQSLIWFLIFLSSMLWTRTFRFRSFVRLLERFFRFVFENIQISNGKKLRSTYNGAFTQDPVEMKKLRFFQQPDLNLFSIEMFSFTFFSSSIGSIRSIEFIKNEMKKRVRKWNTIGRDQTESFSGPRWIIPELLLLNGGFLDIHAMWKWWMTRMERTNNRLKWSSPIFSKYMCRDERMHAAAAWHWCSSTAHHFMSSSTAVNSIGLYSLCIISTSW